MSLPFKLTIDEVLLTADGRRIRFLGHDGGDTLRLQDTRTLAPFLVPHATAGIMVPPTISWLTTEFLATRIRRERPAPVRRDRRGPSADGSEPAPRPDWSQLDRAAALARDKSSNWRQDWTEAARAAGLDTNDAAYAAFITNNTFIGTYWTRTFRAGSVPGDYVSRRGRLKGYSPLHPSVDLLVHEAAVWYWATPWTDVPKAHAFMNERWLRLREKLGDAIGTKPPSEECLRIRVRSLETTESVAKKLGTEHANRLYQIVGNSTEVTRVGERIYLDGVTWRQPCVFDDKWPLPGGFVRSVVATDGFSKFMWGTTAAGPYRDELALETVARIMSPHPDLNEEDLAECPERAWCYLIPETIVQDNDRAQIGPAHVPGLTSLGVRLELPGVYDHDAKQQIEGVFRVAKHDFVGLPGTVHAARRPKDVRSNPYEEASISVRQFAIMFDRWMWAKNLQPREDLGWKSPFQVLQAHLLAGGGADLDDTSRVRRELGRADKAVLVDDGIEYDGIVYRSEALGRVLSNNAHTTKKLYRIETSAKATVSIRAWPGDIDSIQVFDHSQNDFVTAHSTQPAYTAGLSAWEHEQYREYARQRRDQFETETQRLKSRLMTLHAIEQSAAKQAYKRRSHMMALWSSDQLRQMGGARFSTKTFSDRPRDDAIDVAPARPVGGPANPPPGPSTSKKSIEPDKRNSKGDARKGLGAPRVEKLTWREDTSTDPDRDDQEQNGGDGDDEGQHDA